MPLNNTASTTQPDDRNLLRREIAASARAVKATECLICDGKHEDLKRRKDGSVHRINGQIVRRKQCAIELMRQRPTCLHFLDDDVRSGNPDPLDELASLLLAYEANPSLEEMRLSHNTRFSQNVRMGLDVDLEDARCSNSSSSREEVQKAAAPFVLKHRKMVIDIRNYKQLLLETAMGILQRDE